MQKQKRRYLEFEQGLADLDDQIAQLKNLKLQGQVDLSSEIRNLENKAEALLRSICANLTSYQKVQISRHPDRPGTIDYIRLIFDDFVEMHGDRSFRDDASIIGGLASLEGRSLMLIGHQKGKNTEENMKRNFGMPRPEGYRKALRLMKTAERWKIPVLTFIDTPGAYPGIDAEERGQAEAIARNIMKMFGLKIPTLACILGEGGSGGALALACADRVLMMEYSVYSVISPEGCAAITWKDGAHTAAAAEALKLTAKDNEALKVAERIVPEPLGGAHRNEFLAAQNLKSVLSEELDGLVKMSADKREEQRYLRYRGFGRSAQQIVKEGLKKSI